MKGEGHLARSLRSFDPLVAPIVILLIVASAYWKLTLLGEEYVWFDHYDMCQLEVPRLQFLARNLHKGRVPLWNPHAWGGQPVLGVGQPGPVYPLNLLFLAFPLHDEALRIVVLNWWFVTAHFLTAWFFYLFCRAQKLGLAASVLGSLAFACGGYFGSLPWLDIANGASWTPLIFLFAIRIWTETEPWRSAPLLGLVLGLSWLSGHHEIPLLNSYAVLLGTAAVFACQAWTKRCFKLQMPAAIASAFVLAALISAIQTFPLYEFGREAKRWVGPAEPIGWHERVPYEVHERYSLPWQSLLGFATPGTTPEHHTTAFLGLTVVVLAIFGLRHAWRRRSLRIVAILGLFGILYALGANTPFHRLLYEAFPMIDKARTPVRGLYLVSFAVCVLAAYGADLFLRRKPSLKFAFASIFGVLGLVLATAHFDLAPSMNLPSSGVSYVARAAVAAAGVTILAVWRSRTAGYDVIRAVLLTSFVLLDVSIVVDGRLAPFTSSQTVCATTLVEHADLVNTLRSQERLGRITVNWNEVMTNLGDLHGFDQLQAFVAAVPAAVLRHELHTVRTQELFGVTHHVGKTATSDTDVVLARFDSGIQLFQKSNALPRAWVAHRVKHVDNDTELRQAVQDPSVDLTRTALVMQGVPKVEECTGPDHVEFWRPNSDTVRVTASLGCRGLLTVSELQYPGWKAFVEGEQTPLYEVYGVFRGVVLEGGSHVVEMRYEPACVWLGATLSALGILGFLLALCCGRSTAGLHGNVGSFS